MEQPKFWIESMSFSDGSSIPLHSDDILVIVGPNNAGKSTALKDIYEFINSNRTGKVIRSVSPKKSGTDDELIAWLDKVAVKKERNGSLHYFGLKASIVEDHARSFWKSPSSPLQHLRAFFCSYTDTMTRLQLTVPAPNDVDLTTSHANHPSQYLVRNDKLENKLSAAFRDAFGTDLVVHRAAGQTIPLYIGNKPHLAQGEHLVSNSYLNSVENTMSLLNEQGDGMRGFVGVLMNAIVQPYSLHLIDEPSVFLHPPQARVLGRAIIENAPLDCQMIMATHDGEFLRGLLDTKSSRVKVVRIKRDGNTNKATTLDNSKIQQIWADSLLRNSNILDGLFHENVAICESDSDALFYSAMLEIVSSEVNIPKPDCMFTHCGGKDRIPLLVKALKGIGIPLCVIADIDLLKSESPLKSIFETDVDLWTSIKTKRGNFANRINTIENRIKLKEMLSALSDICDAAPEDYLDSGTKAKLLQEIRKAGSWAKIKAGGIDCIEDTDAKGLFESLDTALQKEGIFVLRVGELESFCNDIGFHGPRWVQEALKKNAAGSIQLNTAKDFIKRVFSIS